MFELLGEIVADAGPTRLPIVRGRPGASCDIVRSVARVRSCETTDEASVAALFLRGFAIFMAPLLVSSMIRNLARDPRRGAV